MQIRQDVLVAHQLIPMNATIASSHKKIIINHVEASTQWRTTPHERGSHRRATVKEVKSQWQWNWHRWWTCKGHKTVSDGCIYSEPQEAKLLQEFYLLVSSSSSCCAHPNHKRIGRERVFSQVKFIIETIGESGLQETLELCLLERVNKYDWFVVL